MAQFAFPKGAGGLQCRASHRRQAAFPAFRCAGNSRVPQARALPTAEPHAFPRREAVVKALLALVGTSSSFQASPALALGFQKELKKRKASLEEYSTGDDGLKFLDLVVGKGEEVKDGDKVTVHFDCMYKGIDVVSSRSARLLGGNRTIAEPFEFVAGQPVSGGAAKKVTDSAGGLFSGQGGPKPPPALTTAVLGMHSGGKRSIIVPPELGYGQQGLQEIPPGGTFELRVEVLEVG